MVNKGRRRREVIERRKLSRKAQMSSYGLRADSEKQITQKILRGEASLYRFFSQEKYADDMCCGELLVSTLSECRGYEDPRRGDKGEGELIYHLKSAQGSSDNLDFVKMASRVGISVGPGCMNINIQNARNISRISDGLVVCTTVRFSPEHMTNTYGKYCVEIYNARLFFEIVDNELRKIYGPNLHGRMGLVKYKDREYSDLEPPPGQIGFVKPEDQYAPDKEWRLLWTLTGREAFEPTIIKTTKLTGVCRRIL